LAAFEWDNRSGERVGMPSGEERDRLRDLFRRSELAARYAFLNIALRLGRFAP
jgi:hypothetical protein